jgi:hypothetical protein
MRMSFLEDFTYNLSQGLKKGDMPKEGYFGVLLTQQRSPKVTDETNFLAYFQLSGSSQISLMGIYSSKDLLREPTHKFWFGNINQNSCLQKEIKGKAEALALFASVQQLVCEEGGGVTLRQLADDPEAEERSLHKDFVNMQRQHQMVAVLPGVHP